MPAYKTDIPCPVCGGGRSGSIYKNTNKDTGVPFYMFQCFGTQHGSKGLSRRIEDPNNYEEELTGMSSDNQPHNQTPRSAATSQPQGLLTAGSPMDLRDETHPWGVRKLTEETLAYFGVTVNPNAPISQSSAVIATAAGKGLPTSGPALILPFYDDKDNLVAQKVRTSAHMKGSWYKVDDTAKSRTGFFGQQLWRSNAVREITITFGEFDAMAVFQMLGVPVVSITDGDNSAHGQFRKEFSWLSRFDRITLVPDNDDSCRSIIPLLGAMFPRKTRVVNLTFFKDPCEYLQNDRRDQFISEYRAAQPYTPEKILSISSLKKLLFEDPPVPIATYPWAGLNEKTGGIWAGELITVKAPPKIGKSTFFAEITHHLHETTKYPMGLIYLEETPRDIIYKFASMQLSKNLQRNEIRQTVSRDELEQSIDEFLTDDNIFLVDHFGSCSSDFIEEKIKEFVLAKGCQFVFFDHISMAITDESNKDERIALDRLITSIKALTVGIPDEELDENGKRKMVLRQPTIFQITHVNDAGQPRGSRAALQISNLVIGLERDKQAADKHIRNTTSVIVEENRRLGDSGLACKLLYNKDTGRMTEIPIVDENEDLGQQKPPQHGGYVYQPDRPVFDQSRAAS